jgi:hypothetical protein
MPSFSPAASKHFSTIGRSHPVHKTVLISSFSFRWLKRSLTHCFVSLNLIEISLLIVTESVFPKPSANIQRFFFRASGFAKIFLIDFVTFALSKLQPYVQ